MRRGKGQLASVSNSLHLLLRREFQVFIASLLRDGADSLQVHDVPWPQIEGASSHLSIRKTRLKLESLGDLLY